MVLETSMMPLKFSDFSSLISSASRMTHSPIEIRSARNRCGRSFSALARSSMRMAPQPAHEQQRFHCLARFRAGLVRGLQ